MDVQMPEVQNIEQPKTKSKIELLNEFRKLIEKNGYSIEDMELEALLQKIRNMGLTKHLSLSVEFDKSKSKQVIKVFPKKKIYVEKYDEWVPLDDSLFDDIIANFENPKLFKPFMDEQHNLREKYADIIKLFKKEDGLYAEIELNERGYTAIKNNDYSYISPEWGERTDTDGKHYKNVLWAVTLTNIPAMEGDLPRLQDQIRLEKGQTKKKETAMKNLTIKAGEKTYALQMEVPEEILSVLMEISDSLNAAMAKIGELTQAKEEAEVAAEEMNKELTEIKQTELEKEAVTVIDEAIKKGKYHVALRDMKIRLYKENKQNILDELAVLPENENKRMTGQKQNDNVSLEKEDSEIMKERGLDPTNADHVKLYKEANNG